MGKVHQLHSRITTVLEAARLVRRKIEEASRCIFNTEWIDPANLMGACGIASYVLRNVLKSTDIKCDFVMGHFFASKNDMNDHCWVEVPSEGIIVDVTATQFNIPSEVHVTSIDDERYVGVLKNGKAIDDLRRWKDQSHLMYEDVLKSIIDDVSVELVQSGFVSRTL